MSEPIKPCPFCGKVDIDTDRWSHERWAFCRGCYAQGPVVYLGDGMPHGLLDAEAERLAIAAWNERNRYSRADFVAESQRVLDERGS